MHNRKRTCREYLDRLWSVVLLVAACLASAVPDAAADPLYPGVSAPQMVTTAMGTDVSQQTTSTCPIKINVTGGKFAPDQCRFEIISGGASCGDNAACAPDHTLSLKASAPGPGEIISIQLYNIDRFETGLFRFDPGSKSPSFKGHLLDKGAVVRPLLSGELALEMQGTDQVQVEFDGKFASNISVRASGLLPVTPVNAP